MTLISPGLNLTWVRVNWTPSPSAGLAYYLVELVPLIYDSISGLDVAHPELKLSVKTEVDLFTGMLPTGVTFHTLNPNVKYQVRLAAVDRFQTISPIVISEVISGGSFPALTLGDITLNPLVVHLNGVSVSWSVNNNVLNRITRFEVYAGFLNFTDLTSDRLKYSGLGTTCQIPANSMLYVKVRAIDLIGRSSPVLSGFVDATPEAPAV